MEFHGSPRTLLVHPGISWLTQEFPGSPRNTEERKTEDISSNLHPSPILYVAPL